MSGQIILARSDETQTRFFHWILGSITPLVGPYYILVQFLKELLNSHCFEEGSQTKTKYSTG